MKTMTWGPVSRSHLGMCSGAHANAPHAPLQSGSPLRGPPQPHPEGATLAPILQRSKLGPPLLGAPQDQGYFSASEALSRFLRSGGRQAGWRGQGRHPSCLCFLTCKWAKRGGGSGHRAWTPLPAAGSRYMGNERGSEAASRGMLQDLVGTACLPQPGLTAEVRQKVPEWGVCTQRVELGLPPRAPRGSEQAPLRTELPQPVSVGNSEGGQRLSSCPPHYPSGGP